MEAVKNNGNALANISKRLKDAREIVLEAVKNYAILHNIECDLALETIMAFANFINSLIIIISMKIIKKCQKTLLKSFMNFGKETLNQ